MDAGTRERMIESVKEIFSKAVVQQEKEDFDGARRSLETAEQMLKQIGEKAVKPYLKKVQDAMKSLDEDQCKKKKCSYRVLNDREIKKLIDNDIDPHDLKDDDPYLDLFKCQGSGNVAVGRKSWHQDDDGNWVPGPPIYDDTEINIDDLPWPKKRKNNTIMDRTIIEFRISGLKKPIHEILEKLPVNPDKVHRKDEKRGKSNLKHSHDWLVYSAGDSEKIGFEKAVADLVEKLYSNRQELKKAYGTHTAQLSCIFYFAASRRPIIHFSPETAKMLTDMNASIDVDLYPLPTDE